MCDFSAIGGNSEHSTCMVCMDSFPSSSEGMSCPSGHFICQEDCISYLAKNVFPAVFRMRESHCAIPCPSEGCQCKFNPLHTFHRMPTREKARYKSIMDDVTSNLPGLQVLRSAILDVMTLKCPTCRVPVDPFPDACSAVMCLNCGNHYCNYCFTPFTTGVLAHEHVASHSTNDRPENRDAFLSAELVAEGQRLHQILQLESCVSLALASPEYGVNGGHDVSIALVMCYSEITALKIDVLQLLENSRNIVMTGSSRPLDNEVPTTNTPNKETDPVNNDNAIRKFGAQTSSDEYDLGSGMEYDDNSAPFLDVFDPTNIDDQQPFIPPPSTLVVPTAQIHGYTWDVRRDIIQQPEVVQRQGAIQLANALITYNTEAATQIMHTYRDGSLDVNYIELKHGHPLCSLALITGQSDIALKLLEMGADPLKPNTSGRTVLYMAAEAGLENVIRCILKLHPNIDVNAPITSEHQKYCLTHVAARYNHGHLIRYLASLGADLNLEESEHCYSPLTLSLVLGHCWVASELMYAGAAVRVITTNGRTPMFVAAEKGLGEMIRVMVEDCHIDVNEPVVLPSGLRLIHVAAFHRQAHTVSQLIALGADVNIVDDEGGYNPLTMAIIGGNVSSALTIIKAGADVRAESQSGRLPMYIAVEKGLTEVVRTLITECGIGVNERTTSEISAVTPLHVAVLHGQSHLIPMLISLGADVNMLDEEKHCCPLIAAIILQDEWSVQLLIEAKANANRMSREGRGPMYIAAEKDCGSILRMLVEKCGIDINAPATNEVDKGSPLHVAAMFDNASSVSVLLQMGADIYLKDSLGRTAEEIAKNAFSRKAYGVLRNHAERMIQKAVAVEEMKVTELKVIVPSLKRPNENMDIGTEIEEFGHQGPGSVPSSGPGSGPGSVLDLVECDSAVTITTDDCTTPSFDTSGDTNSTSEEMEEGEVEEMEEEEGEESESDDHNENDCEIECEIACEIGVEIHNKSEMQSEVVIKNESEVYKSVRLGEYDGAEDVDQDTPFSTSLSTLTPTLESEVQVHNCSLFGASSSRRPSSRFYCTCFMSNSGVNKNEDKDLNSI